jgi:hypothetical protein
MPAGDYNFWTDSLVGHGLPDRRDPKRQYRFTVSLLNMESAATWYAKSVTKPSITISETSHTYLNHKFYYPGRVDWGEVSCVLVDPVTPDAAAETMAILEASGYAIPGSPTQTTTISKVRAVNALGGVIIKQIDSAGEPLETWELRNPFIKSVNLGDLNYESDGLSQISLGIRYDYASCTTATQAVATISAEGNEDLSIRGGQPKNQFFFAPDS